jgi:hypothetical protein
MQIDEKNIENILVNMVLEKKSAKLMGPLVLWM